MQLEIKVNTIRFRNDDNGYTVLTSKHGSELQVVAGVFPPIYIGQELVVEGEFEITKYGTQFGVKSIVSLSLSSVAAMQKFLSSGLVAGIGESIAQRIVDKFGESAFDIIEHDCDKLAVIKGITKPKAKLIHDRFVEKKEMQTAVMYLQGLGLGTKTAIKIYKVYDSKTVNMVSQNPYRLVEDIDGIGFVTADKIAIEEGFVLDSDFRVRAGLVYVLKDAAEREGNTYMPIADVKTRTLDLLRAGTGEQIDSIISALIVDNIIKFIKKDEYDTGIMYRQYYRAEKSVASKIAQMVSISDAMVRFDVDLLREFERASNIALHAKQIEAVQVAIDSRVSVITGGPGTGKTTIIKCILSILSAFDMRTVLLAPTGRAAKRMQESTGELASTIHRAFAKNSDSDGQIIADVIIVDEMSMVDIFLMRNLLQSFGDNVKLILVGDRDQLPSVGAGNVLSDILESQLVPSVCLEYVYRQGKESLIARNAHEINKGNMPILDSTTSDFFYSECVSSDIGDKVLDMVVRRLPTFLGVDAINIQVLSPIKNGSAGTISLNQRLQEQINPYSSGRQLVDKIYTFRVGDKVMHTKNSYKLPWTRIINDIVESSEGVFNGDIGIISEIKGSELTVLFEDGKSAVYGTDERNNLTLSYAITVHKSQGSEFDYVVIPLTSGAPTMMTRNLLYTAITRAKRMVVLVGQKANIKRMVGNNYIAKRYSALKYFLQSSYDMQTCLQGDNAIDIDKQNNLQEDMYDESAFDNTTVDMDKD